jgi:hypothetical protein
MAAAQVQHDRAFERCLVARQFSGSAERHLTEISTPEFFKSGPPTAPPYRCAPASKNLFPAYLHGGHETPLRNETDGPASFAHYLPKSFRIER